MRPVAGLLLAALMGAECERAAPETFAPAGGGSTTGVSRAAPGPPSDAASATPAASVPSAGEGARCVQTTPAEPPPAVAPGPAPGCPPDPEGGPGKLPIVHVSFPDAAAVRVDAELVRSEHDSMRGLMYRKSLGADRGMLFDLLVRDDHMFWMHNTCIPLDLLYIDEDGLLVGIVENAPTLNDESRGVGCPSRWVLEVNAGWCRRHGVKAGQHVSLP
jgi:uncharacterized membrane protein (UPF0127 family)